MAWTVRHRTERHRSAPLPQLRQSSGTRVSGATVRIFKQMRERFKGLQVGQDRQPSFSRHCVTREQTLLTGRMFAS